MFGFVDAQLVSQGPFWRIWRDGGVVFMWVDGAIDDAASNAWQDALTKEFERAGYPRFYAMDVSGTDPTNSMSARFRTAQFVRAALQRVESCVLLTKGHAAPLVVVRAILRVVGMSNISLYVDVHAFRAAIDQMRSGVRPSIADPMLPRG